MRAIAANDGDVAGALRADVRELTCRSLTLRHYPLGIEKAIRDLGEEVGVSDEDVAELVGEIDRWLDEFRDSRAAYTLNAERQCAR